MFPGMVNIAIVSDNQDPDGYNRIRVYFPHLEGSQVSNWIPYVSPMIGNGIGLSFLPEVDTPVITISLDKYSTKMIALPGPYTQVHKPPKTEENSDADLNQNGKNDLHFIKSKSGNQVIFDDTEGEEKVQLLSSDKGSRFEFDTKEELINLETDKNYAVEAKEDIKLSAKNILVEAEKEFNVSAETFQVKTEKELEISGDKDLTIKGSGVSLN